METAAVNQMKELVKKLNEAGKGLLSGRPGDHEQSENMTRLYDELDCTWKQKTGIVLSDSPTQLM